MKSNLQILMDINKKVCTLTQDERESILELLKYHECEPMAAAERISELLKVDYYAIFDLL